MHPSSRSRLSVLALAASVLAVAAAPLRADELLVNGTFSTTPALPAGNYSSDVGRAADATAPFTLDGTAGTAGWTNTEPDGRFEVWTPGFMGSPVGVGNTLELANRTVGTTLFQSAVSDAAGLPSAVFSFGYAPRDPGQDAFTASVLDLTSGTTLFSQAFNPTGSFALNQTFSTTLAIVPGDTLQVRFLDQDTVTAFTGGAHVDSVSLFQNVVPEPATWTLLGVGALGLALAAGRRRGARA